MTDQSLFKNLEISDEIKTVLESTSFSVMTKVQASVIPEFMKKDVIVQSQTGSGKTLAYLIPMLNFLYNNKFNPTTNDKTFISGLIIVPTRELSIQIDEVLKLFKFKSEIFIGGTKMEDDNEKLKQEISIAIGTPGRLQEVISSNSKIFSKVKYVVLDESDKLLSFGFEAKLLRILQFLPKNRLTGLFSATINESVNKLSLSFLKNPISIKVTENIPEKLNIKYAVLTPKQKIQKLADLIYKRKSIVFFSTCNTTDYFFELFSRIFSENNEKTQENSHVRTFKDFAIHRIHGKMDQRDRNKIYSGFEKIGGALFCTDVAARGIDFKGIDLVFHFDFPKDYENIVHRSGRTARNGHSGDSIIFLMPNEKSMVEFLKLKGITVELSNLDEFENLEIVEEKGDNHPSNSELNDSSQRFDSTHTSLNQNSDIKKVCIREDEKYLITVDNSTKSHSNVSPDSQINILGTQNIITDKNELKDHKINLNVLEMGKKVMDKTLLDMAVKSFVSYIRGYKEHILNYILNFKELDYDELAEIHFLEKIPSMVELKSIKFKNYEKPDPKPKSK